MNQQEKEALQSFLDELRQVRVQHKDGDAESMIMRAVREQPDAAYLLVQRALLQEQALNTAQQRIAAMQQQLEGTQRGQSGGFFDPTTQWGRSGNAISQPRATGHAGRNLADYPRAGYGGGNRNGGDGGAFYGMPASRPGLMGGGMGSFLGSMAGVAAGVAAGSFLYQGIDHLMHHNDYRDNAQASNNAADVSDSPAPSEQFMDEANQDGGEMARDAGIDDIGFSGDTGPGDGGGSEDYL
jgi:uncharacterized protein